MRADRRHACRLLPSRPARRGRDGPPNSGARPCRAPRCSHGSNRPVAWLVAFSWPGPARRADLPRPGRGTDDAPRTRLRELRGFRVLGSVLYVAAHPDDENTQLIAYLARGRAYRTAYLSLTRGDGGQNVIGPEFFEELGVIRTQELLAARRLDGGQQFFTRAIDFGFSKNPGRDAQDLGSERRRLRHRARHSHVQARRDHHPVLSPRGRPRAPHGVGDPRRRGIQARGRPEGIS